MGRLFSKSFAAAGLGAVVLMLLWSDRSAAALLNLAPGEPDLSAHPVNVDYDAASGSFAVLGSSLTSLDLAGGGTPDYTAADFSGPMSYAINLVLDNAGVPQSGTIEVKGMLAALGANSGTLLTGTISEFGFEDVPVTTMATVFEMVFLTTGGDLEDLYNGEIRVILSAVSGGGNVPFTGSFAADFNYTSSASATDSFVPEPSLGGLALLGIPLLSVIRRKYRRLLSTK